MHLYSHKDANIRKTWFLLTGFFLVVIAFGYALDAYFHNPAIIVWAVGISIAMSLTSYWFSDTIALRMARAHPITRTQSPELYNIVENLCITAGLPVPKIYIIEDSSPNAFATGRNPKHAAIAVTTGLLNRLEKPELEGVIAHELSHIGNWDMLVSTIVVVLVGFISIVADGMLRMIWWNGALRSNNDRGSGPQTAIGMIIIIISALLMPIAATIIQLAISRKREFLADASGALLTRYPEGLARALEKIATDPHPIASANNTTAHLWFESPFKADAAGVPGGKRPTPWFTKLFMTHPPVGERIKALRGIR